jgi:hypothetical protein
MYTNSSFLESTKSVFDSMLNKIEAALLKPTSPMSMLYLIGALVSLGTSEFFLSAIFMTMVVFSNPLMIVYLQDRYQQALSRYQLSKVLVNGAAFVLFAGLMIYLAGVDPTHVQLFDRAGFFVIAAVRSAFSEDWIVWVKLSMNMYRVVFVAHMLVGMARVLQAAKQGEEWNDSVRTPFFIILVGTVGCVSLGAIAGS